ncbi:MAG TPA: phosphate ABC transporter substrate-binding protein PstS, partial [Thermoplasmata archaeon]|nr:phosphate ABC transporter substrate-binding protein PstS [Thermoplasmata archaeon]
RNPAGNWILPTLASTSDAAASASPTLPAPDGDWSTVSILNAPGANSYPVSSLTYLLVYKELNVFGSAMTQARANALVDFVWWAVHEGQNYSAALVYVPLPASIQSLDEGGLQTMMFNGQPLRP